tara:strand:- start:2925 stop:3131 length:207 start_codon:yes stop_codon:yes gene_type:complete
MSSIDDIDQLMSVQDETLLRLLDQLCHYVAYHKLSPEWLAPVTMGHLHEAIAKLRHKADKERWHGQKP